MRLPKPLINLADWVREAALDAWAWIRDFAVVASSRSRPRTAAVLAVGAVVAWALIAGPLEGDGGGRPGSGPLAGPGSLAGPGAGTGNGGPPGLALPATRNTTRFGGADSASNAAAIALATHPPGSTTRPVEAAIVVGADDWQGGIAASVLTGPPVRAPLLISSSQVPAVTAEALALLGPGGSGSPRSGSGAGGSAGTDVYAVGDAAVPDGFEVERVNGSEPAEMAARIDELRGRLSGSDPAHVIVASQDDPAFAMPAAAWAARSGDPVLFASESTLPDATAAALQAHRSASIYVLGPESVISDSVLREISRIAPRVTRVGAPGPVANAIEFARFADSGFGWNINDPGHGLVVANVERPLDAAAAAALSASGQWGPLVVVETAEPLPAELRSFLLDIKPGYRDDPTRAVYNHLWLIGDEAAIGASMQAEIDELAELAPVAPGAG